jgi:uncharacterized Fe-S radical SAM superfamily protein PflX
MPQGAKQRQAIVVNANFHHDLTYDMAKKIENITEAIDLYKSDIHFFEHNVMKKYF